MKLTKTALREFAEYLFAFGIIAGHYSMIERDYKIGIPETLITLVLCVLSLLIVYLNKKNKISRNSFLKIVICLFASLGMMITKGSYTSMGFRQWILPLACFSFMVAACNNSEEIWLKYVNIVWVLAALSLFFYVFGSVLGLIKPSRVAVYLYDKMDKRCNSYYGLLYEAQRIQGISFIRNAVYRNCGVFVEAPMYNLILCMAFAAEAAFRKPRKKVLVLLVISIVTTFTTTGLIFLGVMAVTWILTSEKGDKLRLLKTLLIPLLLLGLWYFVVTIITNKIASVSGGRSYSIRIDHLIACLKMFLDKPIFGHGYGNAAAFYGYTNYQQGFSVGLLALLGRNGIVAFSVYLIPLIYKLREVFKTQKRSQMFFWMGAFFLFFMTASVYKTIFIFLICSQLFRQKCSTNLVSSR